MILSYEGNLGLVKNEQGIWWGKLLHIKDSITFESETESGIRLEFINAICDYREDCRELGKQPEYPDIREVDCDGLVREIEQPKEEGGGLVYFEQTTNLEKERYNRWVTSGY